MSEKTTHISNGINETHYTMITDEERGILVYSGGSLRLHVPPAQLVKLLSEISRVAGSVATGAPKKEPKKEEPDVVALENEDVKRLARDLNRLTNDGLLYVVSLLDKRTADVLKSIL